MGYDPNEQRDYHGRWGAGGGGTPESAAGDATWHKLTLEKEANPENMRKWVDAAADKYGFDKDMIDVVTEPHKFELNGEMKTSAATASSQTGRITVYADPETLKGTRADWVMNNMMPHEIMHQKFASWMADAEAERAEVMKIPPNSVPVEGSVRVDDKGNQVQRMADAMKPDGTLRPPYDERYPTYQQMATLLDNKQNQLMKEDGHTSYSKQWWKEFSGPGKEVKFVIGAGTPSEQEQTGHVGVGIIAPINETLAEMAAMRAQLSDRLAKETASINAEREYAKNYRPEQIKDGNETRPWGPEDEASHDKSLKEALDRIKSAYTGVTGPLTMKANGIVGRSQSKAWNDLYNAVNKHWTQLSKEGKNDPLWYTKHVATRRPFIRNQVG